MGGLGDEGGDAGTADTGLPHVIGEPGAIILSVADEALPAGLARLVALSSGDARLDTLIRLTCGGALSLQPLPSEVDLIDGTPEDESVVVVFAEQFTVDVAGIGDHQRAMLLSTLGNNAFRARGCSYARAGSGDDRSRATPRRGCAQLPVVQVVARQQRVGRRGSESLYSDIERFETSDRLTDSA
ncbi:MAG: hypothetical protein NVS4B6_13510 [Mycobacterium sp.]